MTLRIVYGPPPEDAERIEAVEPEEESCIREQEATLAASQLSGCAVNLVW